MKSPRRGTHGDRQRGCCGCRCKRTAAHPRSAFLSDYANRLCIDYIIIRSIFGTTKSVLSSTHVDIESSLIVTKAKFIAQHMDALSTSSLWPLTNTAKPKVFPLFFCDWWLSVFHFPTKQTRGSLSKNAMLVFIQLLHTHRFYRSQRRRRIHVQCLHLPMKWRTITCTQSQAQSPLAQLKKLPHFSFIENTAEMWRAESRFHFQPPHRRTSNPWNTARTKRRCMLCIRSHNFLIFRKRLFLSSLIIHTKKTL